MTEYSILAEFYDKLMQDFPYERYLQLICSKINCGLGLDLFCGSGKMTVMLSQNGFEMHASDNSDEMLNVAVNAAKLAGQSIIFRREKAEVFEYTKQYDLISAICDGINYLSGKQVKQLFARIKSALKPDGLFVFDISSYYKLTNILGNNLFYEDHDNLTYFWQNRLSNKINTVNMDISFFIKSGDNYYRGDEKHRQYIYKIADLKKMLNDSGLNIAELVDGDTFGRTTPKSKRIVFLVKHNN